MQKTCWRILLSIVFIFIFWNRHKSLEKNFSYSHFVYIYYHVIYPGMFSVVAWIRQRKRKGINVKRKKCFHYFLIKWVDADDSKSGLICDFLWGRNVIIRSISNLFVEISMIQCIIYMLKHTNQLVYSVNYFSLMCSIVEHKPKAKLHKRLNTDQSMIIISIHV